MYFLVKFVLEKQQGEQANNFWRGKTYRLKHENVHTDTNETIYFLKIQWIKIPIPQLIFYIQEYDFPSESLNVSIGILCLHKVHFPSHGHDL